MSNEILPIRDVVMEALHGSRGDIAAMAEVFFELASLLGFASAFIAEGNPEGIESFLNVSREASGAAANAVAPALRLLAQPALGEC